MLRQPVSTRTKQSPTIYNAMLTRTTVNPKP